jgi:hypothetical protein
VNTDAFHLLRTFAKSIVSVIKLEGDRSEGKGEKVVDRVICESLMTSREVSPLVSLACAQLADACRHVSRIGPFHQVAYVPWSKMRWETICTSIALDPELDVYVQNAAWFYPLASVKIPILHLIGKCIPVRCQTRQFPTKIRRALVRVWFQRTSDKLKMPTYDDSAFKSIKQIVLCAILGNYPHCRADTRPTAVVRTRLYDLFSQPRCERWVFKLFHLCAPVVVLCISTYMCVCIDHNPPLRDVLEGIFDVSAFKQIMEEGMCTLRLWFQQQLDWDNQPQSSSIYQSLQRLPDSAARCLLYWCCDLSKCVTIPCPHVDRVFGKLKKTVSEIRKERKKLNKRRRETGEVVPLPDLCNHPGYDGEDEAIHTELKDEAQSGWHWQSETMHDEINQLVAGLDEKAKKTAGFERSHADFEPLLVPLQLRHPLSPLPGLPLSAPQHRIFARDHESPYLQVKQMNALYEIAESCGPVGHQHHALHRMANFFPCLGVPEPVVTEIKSWLNSYCANQTAVEKLKKKFQRLCRQQPHAYNLLQISVELVKQCEKRVRLWDLPYHITAAQLQVLRARPGQPTRVRVNDVAFVYCPVCHHIYSNLRDPNSPYRNCYEHGMREPSVDFVTGKIYCARGYHTHVGACGQQELARIMMIGKVLYFDLKTIMICPQIDCGCLMVFDSKQREYTVYNERGPACMRCSVKLNHQACAIQELEQRYKSHPPEVDCDMCESHKPEVRRITDAFHNAYLYPFHTHLCSKHHSSDLQREVDQHFRTHTNDTLAEKSENERAMLAIMTKYKEKLEQKDSREHQAQLRLIFDRHFRLD